MSAPPLRLAFAVHLHQPIGNFDHVFREHLDEVYRPFLAAVAARGAYPLTLHVSGPLLDWLEANDAPFLDAIGHGAADGHFELLASGRWEPVLAALPRRERLEQIEAMRELLGTRFGVDARGLWLTERVWEPDLAGDLAEAGIEYTLLDDRHFLSAGLRREALDRPWRTEWGGRGVRLLSIDERLRYLIPFRPVDRIETFLGERHAAGDRMLVLGDDGEKFGGWPGTREWVYGEGWLDRFLDMIERLREGGALALITTADAARRESGGLVYPAPGSYREMEAWSLPPAAALELETLELEAREREARETRPGAGTQRQGAEANPWIRGGQWRGFLARYPESGRMHAHANRLSTLCRGRGDRPAARRAIARARCNDAYWHGVFGGIYLPFLRAAAWRELAAAEAELRTGEGLAVETLDWDGDGHDEIWIHSAHVSAIVSPRRGGAIELMLRFATGENDVDVLARHLEAYHGVPGDDPGSGHASRGSPSGDTGAGATGTASGAILTAWGPTLTASGPTLAASGPTLAASGAGAASIHEREPAQRPVPPAVDLRARGLSQERVYEGTPTPEALAAGTASVVLDVGAAPFRLASVDRTEGEAALVLASTCSSITKRLAFETDGNLALDLTWDTAEFPDGSTLATEFSLAHPRRLEPDAEAKVVRYDIITLARSERGFEHILQGEAVAVGWPAGLGRGRVRLATGVPTEDATAT